VHVIRHQDIGMDGAAFAQCDVPEIGTVAEIVRIGEEARLSIVAALDDVLRHGGDVDSGRARHARAVGGRCSILRGKLASVSRGFPRGLVGKVHSDPGFHRFPPVSRPRFPQMSSQDVNVNEWIALVVNRCDRVVVTVAKPFNAKQRSKGNLLLDIRDPDDILSLVKLLEVRNSSYACSWMSPVDFYLNFLFDRQSVGEVGVVLRGFLRASAWSGDCELRRQEDFVRWCQDKGINSKKIWSE
jgi:hypothetical protein